MLKKGLGFKTFGFKGLRGFSLGSEGFRVRGLKQFRIKGLSGLRGLGIIGSRI